MQGEDSDRLEKLQKDIYSREFPEVSNLPRRKASLDGLDVKRQWSQEASPETTAYSPKRRSVLKPIFIGAVIFFLIAVGVAAIIIVRGLNVVSADNVAISFVGPVSIAAGDELDFDVVVQNNNSSTISGVQLYLDYPSGTKQAADSGADLLHEEDTLPNISPGGSARQTVRTRLFGQEHDTKEIQVTVKYSVPNSNAQFEKQKPYDVEISSSPLSMSMSSQSQSVSGAPFSFGISLTSNSSARLSNILVSANYPFGFTLSSTSPATTFASNEWLIPSLDPGETWNASVMGVLTGQENDQRTFQVSAGEQSATNQKVADVTYLSDQSTVTIHKPPLEADISLNNTSDNGLAVISPGVVNGYINLTNTTPGEIFGASASLVLGGSGLDVKTPSANEGIYRPANQTISWSETSLPSLAEIAPGDNVRLNFTFSTLPASTLQALQNGLITLSVTAQGEGATTLGGANSTLTTSVSSTARLQSAVDLLSRLTYSTGPFKNTGPIPPRANINTTYTVTWTVTNASNQVSNATVQGTLPPYVTFVGTKSPTSANLTFNSANNSIIWRAGDLTAAGAAPAASVSFQISVDPTLSQINTTPDVLEDISFTAVDSFTDTSIDFSGGSLTSALPDDPNYGTGAGTVGK